MLRWRIRRWLRHIAYPVFDCEDCFSSQGDAGGQCQCEAYHASAPGEPPTRLQLLALWLLGKLYG
jgi:hypothetical protein